MKCYCGRSTRARGLCSTHYDQWRRANPSDVRNLATRWDDADGVRMECFFPDCKGPIRTQGLCMMHYQHVYYQARKRGQQ